MKKVVIAGGTGFIGSYLEKEFQKLNYQVLIISRQAKHLSWNNDNELCQALENAELLINLAGKSIQCRFTKANKEALLHSRIYTTERLGKIIQTCKNRPKLWINASAIGIYEASQAFPLTENDAKFDQSFLSELAQKWEKTFFSFTNLGIRQIALRIGVVLDSKEGALPILMKLAKFGLGGKQGSGNQMFSWIHIHDLFEIVHFALQKPQLEGIVNAVSANAISNNLLMRALRKKNKIPFGFPSPEWALKIGSFVMGQEADLILKSQWVLPLKLLNSGFSFSYSTIDEVVNSI